MPRSPNRPANRGHISVRRVITMSGCDVSIQRISVLPERDAPARKIGPISELPPPRGPRAGDPARSSWAARRGTGRPGARPGPSRRTSRPRARVRPPPWPPHVRRARGARRSHRRGPSRHPRDDPAGLAIDHHLARPAHRRRDDRQAARHRLDQRDREPFPERRQHERIARGQELGDVPTRCPGSGSVRSAPPPAPGDGCPRAALPHRPGGLGARGACGPRSRRPRPGNGDPSAA